MRYNVTQKVFKIPKKYALKTAKKQEIKMYFYLSNLMLISKKQHELGK